MVATVSYERTTPKLIKVIMDGAFAGYLERGYHKPTGLHAEGYTYWSGTIAGQAISSTTITTAKAKIAKMAP